MARNLGARHSARTILFDDRESAKSLKTVETLYRELIRAGAQRDGVIVAIGGGVVGDVAGFAAATYLRGMGIVHIPTTLVAQVDSSIGGKTGVNLVDGKNLVGMFHQPRLVICDPVLLRTLPAREFRSGVFEIVKYGILGDARLFEFVEKHLDALLRGDVKTLARVIPICAKKKADIVSADERESGVRELLNLGHTTGHALEAATDYRVYLHGEAVGWGLLAATLAAVALDKLSMRDAERIVKLAARIRPIPPLAKVPAARMWEIIQRDKKSRGGEVRWVLPTKIGRAIRGVVVPERVFNEVWQALPSFHSAGLQR